MRYATVADLISALQKMPQDAPVFGYSETDEWCGTNPNVSISTSTEYWYDCWTSSYHWYYSSICILWW